MTDAINVVLNTVTSELVNVNNSTNLVDVDLSNTINSITSEIITKLDPSQQLSITNIVHITTSLMEIIETYNNMSGTNKKSLVINVLVALANKINNQEEKTLVITAINNMVPPIIDAIILASNSKLMINLENKIKSSRFCC